MEVANLLLSQRKGFFQQVEAVKYPVCEEGFGLDPEKLPRYWDDVSGKELKPEKVVAARKEEISVIDDMGVWEVIPRPKGEKVISTCWVDVNKGDEEKEKKADDELKKKADDD